MRWCGCILSSLVVLAVGCQSADMETADTKTPQPAGQPDFTQRYERVEVPWDTPPAENPQADALPRLPFEQNEPADPVWQLHQEQEIMDAAVNLTDQQQRAMAELREAEKQAVEKWEERHQARLDELRDQINRLWDERNWLNHQRAKINFLYQAKRRGVLTRRQNHDLRSFLLYQMIMHRKGIREMGLTEEQRRQIRDLCDESAPQSFALIGETHRRQRAELRARLRQRIIDEVLTPAQRSLAGAKSGETKGKGSPVPETSPSGTRPAG